MVSAEHNVTIKKKKTWWEKKSMTVALRRLLHSKLDEQFT